MKLDLSCELCSKTCAYVYAVEFLAPYAPRRSTKHYHVCPECFAIERDKATLAWAVMVEHIGNGRLY